MGADLSLVVPCFNAGEDIDRALRALRAWSASRPGRLAEVLLVDDGSHDDTPARMALWRRRWRRVRVLRLAENAGKGEALRRGVAEARGAFIGFLDVDMAVGPEFLDPLCAALEGGADIAVGCRNLPGSVMERPQGLVRRVLGRGYLWAARTLLRLRVPDVTCGFKVFRRARVQSLFAETRCDRWGLDAELLYLTAQAGLSHAAVPVVWRDGRRSSVRLGRDVFGAARELLGVRLRGWTGAYTSEPAAGETRVATELRTGATPELRTEMLTTTVHGE